MLGTGHVIVAIIIVVQVVIGTVDCITRGGNIDVAAIIAQTPMSILVIRCANSYYTGRGLRDRNCDQPPYSRRPQR